MLGPNRLWAMAAVTLALVGVGAVDENPAVWLLMTVAAAGCILRVRN